MRRCIMVVWVTSCCSKDSNDPGKVSMRWEEGKLVKQLTAPQSPGRNAYRYCVYNESLRHSHCQAHRHKNDEPPREAHLPRGIAAAGRKSQWEDCRFLRVGVDEP